MEIYGDIWRYFMGILHVHISNDDLVCVICVSIRTSPTKNRDFTKNYGTTGFALWSRNVATNIHFQTIFPLESFSLCGNVQAICNYRRATPSNNPLNLHLSHSYPEMIPLNQYLPSRLQPGFYLVLKPVES